MISCSAWAGLFNNAARKKNSFFCSFSNLLSQSSSESSLEASGAVLGIDLTSAGSSVHCVKCPQDSINREFEVTVKQVVRSLSSWMQTLIPTSVGKPTRRKGSVRLKTNASECLELRALPAALIGVDFGPANGSPKNWKNFGGSTNGTIAQLTDEDGVASNVRLDIAYADGRGGGVNPTFAASQLPKHSQSLAGLSGAIRDDSKIRLTFKNLTPSGVYEVYVFGGSTQADTQYITLAGSGQSQKFSQILDPGKLVVNGLAGSSAKDLSTYVKKVTATASGQITISAEGVELPECSLAGVAIRPVLPVVPDIQLNSVKSDGESTLTVQYTIKNAAVKPFRIAAYASEDTLLSKANDKLTGFVQIAKAADLTPGQHTKTYKIGQEIKLHNAGATATYKDYLLFVADDNNLVPEDDKDPFNEDNNSVFSGAYVGNGTLTIFGRSGPDTIELANAGQTLNVSSAHVNRSYTGKIDRVYVFAGGAVDNVLASRLTVPITVDGGEGNDSLIGGSSNDSLFGGAGNDSLHGKDGNDVLFGGDGNDDLRGNDGNDQMHGQGGDDTMEGGAGNDYMLGHDGNDRMLGGKGNDEISGNDGNDKMHGDDGNDSLDGDAGDDEVNGGDDNDIVVGGAGADKLYGGVGEDILISGTATAFDTEAGRLALIQAWSSGDTLDRRVGYIRGGVSMGLEPRVSLKRGVNVKDDGSKDQLFKAGTGIDWVFYRDGQDTFASGTGDILELL
jgi:Ca2+-binding RTX toxin-like protein